MIKDNEAVVETNVAIGQLKIVGGAAREFGFGEIFKVVTPVSKTAAQRERKINLVEQFVKRHERVEQMPRVAELDLGRGAWCVVRDLTL